MSAPEVCIQLDFIGRGSPEWFPGISNGYLSRAATVVEGDFQSFVLFFVGTAWFIEFTWDRARWRLLPSGVQKLAPDLRTVVEEIEWESHGGEPSMPIFRLTLTQA
jgi:hypothetical protein